MIIIIEFILINESGTVQCLGIKEIRHKNALWRKKHRKVSHASVHTVCEIPLLPPKLHCYVENRTRLQQRPCQSFKCTGLRSEVPRIYSAVHSRFHNGRLYLNRRVNPWYFTSQSCAFNSRLSELCRFTN